MCHWKLKLSKTTSTQWLTTDLYQRKHSTYLDEMCQSRIFLKMVTIVSSSNSLIVIVLKCLKNLGVTGFLPPPKIKQVTISTIES